MEEFIREIIETGLGYIPEFNMKDIIILVVSLIICLLFAMFGYKLLKGFVCFFNLLVGAFAGLSVAEALKLDDTFHLVLMLVFAVIFSLVGFFLYKVGLFMVVASSVFSAAMSVLPSFVQSEYLVPAALVTALLLGIFAAFFVRPIVIVVSSIAGGIMFSNILTDFVLSKIKALDPSGATAAVVLVLGGLIGIFGMYWQFTHTKKEAQVKKLGMDSCAITDHGVMYGCIDFYKECKAQGIRPIIGCEVYVAPHSRFDRDTAAREDRYYHLVLLAENDKGYANLTRIVSAGFTDGYYYKPRVDKEILREYHEGIICLSACLAGEIPKAITRGDYEGARKAAYEYRDIFGKDNFFLELQDHGIPEQKHVNRQLVRMHDEEGFPLVCTND